MRKQIKASVVIIAVIVCAAMFSFAVLAHGIRGASGRDGKTLLNDILGDETEYRGIVSEAYGSFQNSKLFETEELQCFVSEKGEYVEGFIAKDMFYVPSVLRIDEKDLEKEAYNLFMKNMQDFVSGNKINVINHGFDGATYLIEIVDLDNKIETGVKASFCYFPDGKLSSAVFLKPEVVFEDISKIITQEEAYSIAMNALEENLGDVFEDYKFNGIYEANVKTLRDIRYWEVVVEDVSDNDVSFIVNIEAYSGELLDVFKPLM